MIKILLIAGIIFFSIVFALTAYLAPNDTKSCNMKITEITPCQKVDAIVAISGGDTAARTEEAVRLYDNGWADTVIFSGAALDKTGPSNASAMRSQAIDAGVPESAILIEELSETTKQNAEQTQSIISSNNIKSIVLVTSSYHQRRASLEFNKRADGNISIVNHPVVTDNDWSSLWWLTPWGWYLALSEFFKTMVFYIGVTR